MENAEMNHFLASGEHAFTLTGPAGQLDACVTNPRDRRRDIVGIICHPHSQQGGTMNNKVVTTVARTLRDLQISSVRFNFRSVGGSEGDFDQGMGESEDLSAVIHWVQQTLQPERIILVGFSFGSYVAYRVAGVHRVAQLCLIAPPVHHYDYVTLPIPQCPILVVQGDEDEVVPADQVFSWVDTLQPKPVLVRFPKTGHFFHGQLIALRQTLATHFTEI